ncbi:hypothetical protein DSL72_004721 [Monilinia vaccinii-corymbosi]|uniref:Uncharacterized protein n=1 Tax=Monilinia vaccinii-corymbosi TaxID=61207 RepID=A0A8A3P580_9HELO|nr:hypothetical protein DSL72_004721 [Monilinia vaccinii-corymbosi]
MSHEHLSVNDALRANSFSNHRKITFTTWICKNIQSPPKFFYSPVIYFGQLNYQFWKEQGLWVLYLELPDTFINGIAGMISRSWNDGDSRPTSGLIIKPAGLGIPNLSTYERTYVMVPEWAISDYTELGLIAESGTFHGYIAFGSFEHIQSGRQFIKILLLSPLHSYARTGYAWDGDGERDFLIYRDDELLRMSFVQVCTSSTFPVKK